jgi:hypothetical protein
VNGCSHPIRLRGWHERIDGTTGELLARVVTAREPGGVLLVACGDRRSAVCPACAETYRHDAYQLVASGLRGGKGVPESVAGSPAVMVTLTAPSFGRVHTICDHDRPCWCGGRHGLEDDVLGTPVDPSAYRYVDQAVWNHLAPVLWKRTVQEVRRELARALSVPRQRLGTTVRVRFVKASEFQRRGVVHYHAVIRLDGPNGTGSEPPASCTAALLVRVVGRAVRRVDVAVPHTGSPALGPSVVAWGRQAEITPLDLADAGKAAGYIAKYATKATEVVADGILLMRVRGPRELAELDAPLHAKRLAEAAWKVGNVQGLEGARRWAHQFGYGGHTLTKSRDYSVTFGALREARVAWCSGHENDIGRSVIRRGTLAYAGRDGSVAAGRVDELRRTLGTVGERRQGQ